MFNGPTSLQGAVGRRDHPHPVGEVPLAIVELEDGIVEPPHPLVGQYRQVVGEPDDHAPVADTGYPPAGAFEAPLYLFPGYRVPLSSRCPFISGYAPEEFLTGRPTF